MYDSCQSQGVDLELIPELRASHRLLLGYEIDMCLKKPTFSVNAYNLASSLLLPSPAMS